MQRTACVAASERFQQLIKLINSRGISLIKNLWRGIRSHTTTEDLMALTYVHGKWLHDRANKDKDPIAIQVKRLWSSENDRSFNGRRWAVVSEIGRERWSVLEACRPLLSKEQFYHAVYDAIVAVRDTPTLVQLPALQLLR